MQNSYEMWFDQPYEGLICTIKLSGRTSRKSFHCSVVVTSGGVRAQLVACRWQFTFGSAILKQIRHTEHDDEADDESLQGSGQDIRP